jgi:hypothetical protein
MPRSRRLPHVVTLLNVIYKIAAKAYQLRLSSILEQFISSNQSACLSGRSIHHSIILMAEMLFYANNNECDQLFLKLDMVKAFDMVEWDFLVALLDKCGFGPNFIRFLTASQATQSSAVRINSRTSDTFVRGAHFRLCFLYLL